MRWRNCVVTIAALCVGAAPMANPQEASSGPSLSATVTFIQQKLNQIGPLQFANYVHDNASGQDWIVQKYFEVSNVKPYTDNCGITYHSTVKNNGKVTGDSDAGIPFRQADDVTILPIEQVWKELDSKDGNTTWTYRPDPAVWVLRVRRGDGTFNELDFTDQTMADRVAKALVHAIELCGGGNKDPF